MRYAHAVKSSLATLILHIRQRSALPSMMNTGRDGLVAAYLGMKADQNRP